MTTRPDALEVLDAMVQENAASGCMFTAVFLTGLRQAVADEQHPWAYLRGATDAADLVVKLMRSPDDDAS